MESGVGLRDEVSAAADAAGGVGRARAGRAFGGVVANVRRLLHVCCRPLPTRHPGQGSGAGAIIVRAPAALRKLPQR